MDAKTLPLFETVTAPVPTELGRPVPKPISKPVARRLKRMPVPNRSVSTAPAARQVELWGTRPNATDYRTGVDNTGVDNLDGGAAGRSKMHFPTHASADLLNTDDEHIQTAIRLSKALRETYRQKAFRKSRVGRQGSTKLATRPAIDKKIGNAICDHILASLREQVRSENLH